MSGVGWCFDVVRYQSAKNGVFYEFTFVTNHTFAWLLPMRDENGSSTSRSQWNVVLQCFALSQSAAAVFTQEFQFFSLFKPSFLHTHTLSSYCGGAPRFRDGRLECNYRTALCISHLCFLFAIRTKCLTKRIFLQRAERHFSDSTHGARLSQATNESASFWRLLKCPSLNYALGSHL